MLSIARTPSWLRPDGSGSGPGGQSEEGMELSSWIGLETGCQNIEGVQTILCFSYFIFLKDLLNFELCVCVHLCLYT